MKNRSLPGAAGSAPIPKGEKKRIAASGVVLMVLCVFLLVALIVVLLTSAPKPGPEDMALRYAQAQLVLDWAEMDEFAHVAYYTEQGLSKNDAIKAAAKDRGVGKSEIYNIVMKK